MSRNKERHHFYHTEGLLCHPFHNQPQNDTDCVIIWVCYHSILMYHSTLAYYSPHWSNSIWNNASGLAEGLKQTQAGFIDLSTNVMMAYQIWENTKHKMNYFVCCELHNGVSCNPTVKSSLSVSLFRFVVWFIFQVRDQCLLLHPVLPPGGPVCAIKVVAESSLI